MGKLTIYGIPTNNGFSFRTMAGDTVDNSAFNTMMQVLKNLKK